MPYFPTLPATSTYRVATDQFLGLDRNARTQDGTFADMTNMTGDDFPVLSTRRPRKFSQTLSSPQGMLAKDALFWVDGATLYNNGTAVTGVTLSTLTTMQPKTLISMGAYLLIWPDKYYVNTADLSDKGYIEQTNTITGVTVTYTLCKNDGTVYDNPPAVSTQAPASPSNEDLWIDSSSSPHALKQYDAASGQWVEIATTYVKISATGIGAGLSQYDGITLSGCAADAGGDPDVEAQITALNGDIIVYAADTNYIVVVGILDNATSQTTGTVTAARTVPDMDYITESQNRLWGCKYGLVNGQTVNEIRCCALGDFKNWSQFLGLSTDSWVGSQGTDGQWTGAVTHLGYPVFFKENCLHKVYISSQGAHQVVTTICRGVQKGSDRSLAIVDEQLYYKARAGVMRYDGSLPVCISDDLGAEFYYNAVGGAFGKKYYVSMKNESNEWGLYVYDTTHGFWHKEDDMQALWFAKIDDSLMVIDSAKKLWDLNGMKNTWTDEDPFEWSATTGIIGLEYPDQKRLYRFNIRMDLEEDAACMVEVQYDGLGEWIPVARGFGRGLGTLTIPVVPRRCDHMQVRISGTGQAKIYSFARILEISGDKQ